MKLINFKKITVFVITILLSSLSFAEPIWIDVRSLVEHGLDNIDGDVHIAHEDIVHEVSELYPDENTEIRLYCGSGRRASKAMSALIIAGYRNISNAGGIADARKERGLNQ